MKNVNLRRPWLAQSYPLPQSTHKNLAKELARAKSAVQKIGRRVSVLRRQHMALQKKLVGPFTIEMIVLTGRYERAKQERRIAMEKLHVLRTIERSRKNVNSRQK